MTQGDTFYTKNIPQFFLRKKKSLKRVKVNENRDIKVEEKDQ